MEYESPSGVDQMELAAVEQLVRPDHLLRKIKKYIDFDFIRKKAAPYYTSNERIGGRPPLDPVLLFKMLFLGYLYGIRSERRLEQEVRDNVAYRWFLGLSFHDRVPDHSTISQNRRRRFAGTTIYQEIFDEIVQQAMKKGFIKGEVLYTDSTHIKANANKKKFRLEQVPESTKGYLTELEKAVEEDRAKHGKKRLPGRKEVSSRTREIKVSTTDPDSGYMYREGKPEGFFYLEHRTVDGEHNFITDSHVTSGAVNDTVPYVERLKRQQERFGLKVRAVALDAGYLATFITHYLAEQGIFTVIGHRRYQPVKGRLPKWKYDYDPETDTYHCPGDHILTYRTTNREGYREYRSDPQDCQGCLLRAICTGSYNAVKTITRHVWEESREQVRQNRLSPYGKEIYQGRKETIERSFAESKELYGLRYARMRGLLKVQEQCLLTAATQNMKKLALLLDRQSSRARCA
jgi:transposase